MVDYLLRHQLIVAPTSSSSLVMAHILFMVLQHMQLHDFEGATIIVHVIVFSSTTCVSSIRMTYMKETIDT